MQNLAGLRIRIRIILRSWILIRIRISYNSGALEAQAGAIEGQGRSQWRQEAQNKALEGLNTIGRRFATLSRGAGLGSGSALK